MAAPRKKWATRAHPADGRMTWPSKPAAYRETQRLAELFATGRLRRDLRRVTVWVDEGLGRGWELYETVDLSELAGMKENES